MTQEIKSQLSAKSLAKLREELPRGAQQVIAEQFSLSKSTVSRILTGEIENLEIIEFAIGLVKQKRDKIDALNSQIEKL